MPLEIPVSQSAYSSITVDLDQETFRFDLRWNTREEAWYMDIRQVDDTPIRLGVKITPMSPINLPYRTGGMPRGRLQVLPERASISRVGRYDFGTNAKLYYISPDEAAEVGAALLATEVAIAGPVVAPEAPELTALYVDASGTTLVAIFSELLASISGVIGTGFTLLIDAVPVTPTSATIFGNAIYFGIPTTESTEVVTLSYSAITGDIWSTDFVYLATFAAVTASNISQAVPAAPTLVAGSVASNGRSISLSFSETITAGTPPTGFTYTLNAGAPIAPTGGSLAAGGVLLDTGIILSTDTVAVQYTDVAGDLAGVAGDVVTFSSAITNSSTLVTPTLVSAVVGTDGSQLVLTFNQDLTGSATLGFSLTADAVNVPVLSGTVAGSVVTLTVEAIFSGDVVLVSYTDVAGTLTGAGGDLPSFTNSAVTNNSTRIPPTLVSASIAANGTTVNLTFTENLNGAGNATAGFTYYVNGSPVTPSGGSISTNTITHTLALVYDDDVVTLNYDDAIGDIEASSGGADMVTFTGVAVVNGSTQQSFRIDTAVVDAAGTTLTITMPEAIKVGSNATNGWTLKVNGSAVTITSGSVVGSTLVWTVPQIYGLDAVTISYAPASGNVLAASDDTELATYTDYSVANNSTSGWTPASLPGILDYGIWSDTSRLKQNTAGTTPVTSPGDTVKWWRGQRDVLTLTQVVEVDGISYTSAGVVVNSGRKLWASYSRSGASQKLTAAVWDSGTGAAEIGFGSVSGGSGWIQAGSGTGIFIGYPVTAPGQAYVRGTTTLPSPNTVPSNPVQIVSYNGSTGTAFRKSGVTFSATAGTYGTTSDIGVGGNGITAYKFWLFGTQAISPADADRLITYMNAIA